jgi:hypothetical protein
MTIQKNSVQAQTVSGDVTTVQINLNAEIAKNRRESQSIRGAPYMIELAARKPVRRTIMVSICWLMLPILGLGSASPEKASVAPMPRKELQVSRVTFPTRLPTLGAVTKVLDAENIPFHPITCGWEEFPYKPEVNFRIAYSDHELYLQYQVREKYMLAQCDLNDDACWPANDSCVEFFVSPESDDQYLNFEFSCIGYCLIESGRKGTKRLRLPQETTVQVRRESTMGSETFEHREGDFSWTLTVAIPLSIITGQERPNLSGKTWKANFYKCGDNLKEKAYLAWSPVVVEEPSFHQPQEFGTIVFE